MDLLPTDKARVLSVGGRFYAPTGNKVFSFTQLEEEFLAALSANPSVELALQTIGKDEEWGKRFFQNPKIREWISIKCAQHAAKSGTTQEWFFAQLRAVWEGREEWWVAECEEHNWKVQQYTQPEEFHNGKPSLNCGICGNPIEAKHFERPIKPSREQMEALKEAGARVAPKIERIQHEFEDADFVFMAKGKQ